MSSVDKIAKFLKVSTDTLFQNPDYMDGDFSGSDEADHCIREKAKRYRNKGCQVFGVFKEIIVPISRRASDMDFELFNAFVVYKSQDKKLVTAQNSVVNFTQAPLQPSKINKNNSKNEFLPPKNEQLAKLSIPVFNYIDLGNIARLNQLIEAGFKFNSVDQKRLKVKLLNLIRSGNINMSNFLLKNAIKFESFEFESLKEIMMDCLKNTKINILEFLVSEGFDLNAVTLEEFKSIGSALENKLIQSWLSKHGVNLER